MFRACHRVCVCLSGFVYPVNPFPSPPSFLPQAFLLSRVLGTCSSSVPFASALLGGTPRPVCAAPLTDWKSPWAGTEALLPGAVLGGKAWSLGFSMRGLQTPVRAESRLAWNRAQQGGFSEYSV